MFQVSSFCKFGTRKFRHDQMTRAALVWTRAFLPNDSSVNKSIVALARAGHDVGCCMA